jgi:CheY-like chemotaxis protein
VELGRSSFQFGAAQQEPHLRFLQLGAKIGNHGEVAVEWSGEFGMSGAKLLGPWKDHIYLGNNQGELPDGCTLLAKFCRNPAEPCSPIVLVAGGYRTIYCSLVDGQSRLFQTVAYPPSKFTSLSVPMRILVAENDAPLANFLCQKLEAEQFSVELIPGTHEAQPYISECACDLALLDLALPCAVGVEVLRNIRTKKPELPLLFLTASANADELARCLDAGADDLVPQAVRICRIGRPHPRSAASRCKLHERTSAGR